MISSLKDKPVLVTGAGGFIGSHLVESLIRRKARVTALVRYTSAGKAGWLEEMPAELKAELKILYGDIRDPDICRAAVEGNGHIFHLAAQIAIPYSYIAPRDFVAVNVMGTANILSTAKEAGVRKFLHVSTSEVYGTAQYVPIDENHRQTAQSPYAASKIGADKLVESFHLSFGLPTVTVRPFNCYGPRQSARAILPTIILQALRGKNIRLGNISARRDMNFVEDLAGGMIAAVFAKSTIGRTMNLATGKDYAVEEMVGLVGDLIGKKLIIKTEKRRIRPDKSEVQRLQGDSSLARKLIGYKPRNTLKEGLALTIEFFEKNIDRYRNEDYQV